MKPRTLMAAMTFFVALALPVWLAAQDQPQSATNVDTGTTNPVPLIDQPLVPDAKSPGGAGFTLTVNGTGFVSGAVVKWNGSARTTAFVSNSQLKATILASDIATASTAWVTVVNPSPGGGTSNLVFFEVTSATLSVAMSESSFAAGSNPVSVAVGDFNGDGNLDLALADYGSNNVSVLLGNGEGAFLAAVSYAVGPGPYSVAVGDFNGDGKLDLAVANSGNNYVSVLLGNGDGTFQSAANYNAGSGPQAVAVGDFNSDGKLDLAVANYPSNNVSVLLGNGDGTFSKPLNYAVGPGPSWVAVGDFNGDGKLDLAVADVQANEVSVLLGNGDGTFQSAVNYAVGVSASSVAVGDFNGDGKLDLAVANFSSGNVSVLLGNGDGTFQSAANYSAGSKPEAVAVGDFNGDGNLDLAVADLQHNNVSVLLGNGDGTFQAALNYAAGAETFAVAVGDFNDTGRVGLAVPDAVNNVVDVLLQSTTVTLTPASLNFGAQVIGTRSHFQFLTLSNTGSLELTIASIAFTPDPSDFSQTNNCNSRLSPGAKCAILVTFTPTQIGPRTASVTVTDNAPNSPQSATLSGTGVTSGPNATVSPSSLTFATQLVGTPSPAQLVTLTNYGAMTLDITSITTTGDFSESNTCGSSLPTLASCTINVTFTPTQRGSRLGTLSISDNAPGSPQIVALSGTGTVVQFNPASLNFGSVQVGQHKILTTTLTNTGSTTLNIASITASPNPPFSETNNCGSSVGAHMSCTITVTFGPKQEGTFTGAVLVSDDGGGSPQQVSLSGTGHVSGFCGGPCGLGCPSRCPCNPFFQKCLAVVNELLPDELLPKENLAASVACGK